MGRASVTSDIRSALRVLVSEDTAVKAILERAGSLILPESIGIYRGYGGEAIRVTERHIAVNLGYFTAIAPMMIKPLVRFELLRFGYRQLYWNPPAAAA